MNFAIWWDADTTRELLDGINITKWNYLNNTNPAIFTATGSASNNGTKATPNLSADLLGDWREEVIFRTTDNTKLRIYSTTAIADNRFYTLMHDPHYRVAIAWQNSAYNQPPHPGFYLGHGMLPQPNANIYIAGADDALPVQWLHFDAKNQGETVILTWSTAAEVNNHHYMIERSADGINFTNLGSIKAKGNQQHNNYKHNDLQPLSGISYYRIRQVDKDGKFSYSTTKMVNRNKAGATLQVFPNPVGTGHRVQLKYSGNAHKLQLQITNIEGQIMRKASGSLAELTQQVNEWLPLQAPGLYVLTLHDNQHRHTAKLLKQ
jgi:hypothetical protein